MSDFESSSRSWWILVFFFLCLGALSFLAYHTSVPVAVSAAILSWRSLRVVRVLVKFGRFQRNFDSLTSCIGVVEVALGVLIFLRFGGVSISSANYTWWIATCTVALSIIVLLGAWYRTRAATPKQMKFLSLRMAQTAGARSNYVGALILASFCAAQALVDAHKPDISGLATLLAILPVTINLLLVSEFAYLVWCSLSKQSFIRAGSDERPRK